MENSLSNEGRKQDNADMLVIGISSQALFGLRESHELFDAKGLEALHEIQSAYPITDNPIRIALVTARSAPAHKRVVLTLREWGIRIDEALFLGGRSKGEFFKAFGADIFFRRPARPYRISQCTSRHRSCPHRHHE